MWFKVILVCVFLAGSGYTKEFMKIKPDFNNVDKLVIDKDVAASEDIDIEIVKDVVERPDHGSIFTAKALNFAHQISTDPQLKAEWEKQVEDASDPSIAFDPAIPDFLCDTSVQYPPATSVNNLRPSDINVVAAMGDSISAGNGLGANRLLAVALENRGEVWDVGGDFTLAEGVITLSNVLKLYNPDLKGASVCISQYTHARKSWMNAAEPGGVSRDMPYQAQLIVDRCKSDERIDFDNDWKMVTLFIGGNDLCGACDRDDPDWIDPGHTPQRFYQDLKEAMDIFHTQLPRTFVNLVPLFDIRPLNEFTDVVCTLSHFFFCECVLTNTSMVGEYQRAYYDAMRNLSDTGVYERDDFTVVTQPMWVDADIPRNETGHPIRSFLSPDCFHPGRGAHQAFAFTLWNSMLRPVGQKPTDVVEYLDWECPTTERPYFATAVNSQAPRE